MGAPDSIWICIVRELLQDGYGVEDIAVRLCCPVGIVRLEVSILREQGAFTRPFFRGHRGGA